MSEPGFPEAGTARVQVLHEGYVREDRQGNRVASTVVLIIDGTRVIVVDPGMVADARRTGQAALAGGGPRSWRRDRRGVQPSPSRPHRQRSAVPCRRIQITGLSMTVTCGSAGSRAISRSPARSGWWPLPATLPRTSPRWPPPPRASTPAPTPGGRRRALRRIRSRPIGGAGREPGADPGRGHGDRSWPRARVPAGPGHAAVAARRPAHAGAAQGQATSPLIENDSQPASRQDERASGHDGAACPPRHAERRVQHRRVVRDGVRDPSE